MPKRFMDGFTDEIVFPNEIHPLQPLEHLRRRKSRGFIDHILFFIIKNTIDIRLLWLECSRDRHHRCQAPGNQAKA
jgi:hypothetical protein